MNIFVLDDDPIASAHMMCDKHIPKMVVESAQMMASALRRHGAGDEQMPLTKSGTPYKGGYKHHPCTVWAGDSDTNFLWLANHAIVLCQEYKKRFGKVHACQNAIHQMSHMMPYVGEEMTPFAQAMPDEYRNPCAITAYRAYYHSKTFAKWEKGDARTKLVDGGDSMNEIRLSKEMKFMLLHLMAYGDTPMRFVGQIYNEFVDNPTELPNSKLLKDTIRLLKHCDNYWDGGYVEEFTAEMKKVITTFGGDSMSDPKLECKHCGSTDLEFKMWVNQDMEITDDCDENPYCNVCEEETRVKV